MRGSVPSVGACSADTFAADHARRAATGARNTLCLYRTRNAPDTVFSVSRHSTRLRHRARPLNRLVCSRRQPVARTAGIR